MPSLCRRALTWRTDLCTCSPVLMKRTVFPPLPNVWIGRTVTAAFCASPHESWTWAEPTSVPVRHASPGPGTSATGELFFAQFSHLAPWQGPYVFFFNLLAAFTLFFVFFKNNCKDILREQGTLLWGSFGFCVFASQTCFINLLKQHQRGGHLKGVLSDE